MSTPNKPNNICPKCGKEFNLWCTRCRVVEDQERLPEIMDSYGLTVDSLIGELALHVAGGHFPALSLALGMKGLGALKRVELGGEVKHTMFGDLLKAAEDDE